MVLTKKLSCESSSTIIYSVCSLGEKYHYSKSSGTWGYAEKKNIDFILGNVLILCMEKDFSEKIKFFQENIPYHFFFNTRSGFSCLFTFERASFFRIYSVPGFWKKNSLIYIEHWKLSIHICIIFSIFLFWYSWASIFWSNENT